MSACKEAMAIKETQIVLDEADKNRTGSSEGLIATPLIA